MLLLRPDVVRVESLPDPDGRPLTVRLQEEGAMTEARFVELVVEVLQADHRYQEKMLEVLEEVRPEASLAEGGSNEDDPHRTERVAFADENSPPTRSTSCLGRRSPVSTECRRNPGPDPAHPRRPRCERPT